MSEWTEWQRTKRAEKLGLDTAGLVKELAPDPTTAKQDPPKPNVIPIVGLVGKAVKENVWRIYLNWSLSEYYEIREARIKAVRPVDDGRSRVWVENVKGAIEYVDLSPGEEGDGELLSVPHLVLAAKIAQEADWNGYARALPEPQGWSLLAP
jgi:hypothetical protein